MVSDKSLKNLIPVTKRTKEEARAISVKGGKGNKNNPKSKLAARLREMRKRGFDDEKVRWLYDMMTDSELAAFQIIKVMQDILENSEDNKEKAMAAKLLLDWSKMKHGTAESNKKLTIQIQQLSPEEKEAEINRLIMIK
jgi:hypothetical protein